MKENTVLIIPDVHGRDFWRDGVKARKEGETIIFLGDYTDPYPHEGISHKVVPDMLEEILKLPDTILLLGNHDFSYIYPSHSPFVRRDWDVGRIKRLTELFMDNRERFKIAHRIERGNGTSVVFSHAGFLKNLYHRWRGTKNSPTKVTEIFNDWWWKGEDEELMKELFLVSWLRGGYDKSGSVVWADLREHLGAEQFMWSRDYQVFGHTMLREGVIIQRPMFACLDCQRPVRMWIEPKKPVFEVINTQEKELERD